MQQVNPKLYNDIEKFLNKAIRENVVDEDISEELKNFAEYLYL